MQKVWFFFLWSIWCCQFKIIISSLFTFIKFVAFLSFQIARFVGQILVGNVFGIMVMLAVPGQDELGVDLYFVGQLIAPTATAIGREWIWNFFYYVPKINWRLYFVLVISSVTKPRKLIDIYIDVSIHVTFKGQLTLHHESSHPKERDSLRFFPLNSTIGYSVLQLEGSQTFLTMTQK